MVQLLPYAIMGLAAGALVTDTTRKREKGVLTPERKIVFETAINDVKDVDKLRALAKAFRDEGLPHHADFLEKRARLRQLPPETKAARKEVFRKAMASDNPQAIMGVAAAYERDGATGAANALREYARSLVKVDSKKSTAPIETSAIEQTEIKETDTPAETKELDSESKPEGTE